MIIIETLDNGYVVREMIEKEEGAGLVPDQELVVEQDERDSGYTQPFTTQNLLYTIIELLCQSGSKHDEERIRVIVHDQEDNIIDDCGYKEKIVCEFAETEAQEE